MGAVFCTTYLFPFGLFRSLKYFIVQQENVSSDFFILLISLLRRQGTPQGYRLPLRLFAAVLQLVYSIFQIRSKWKTVRFVSLVADNGISCCIGEEKSCGRNSFCWRDFPVSGT
jgi:hypothetical protein